MFLNSSDKPATVETAGVTFTVPAGQSVTVPVSAEILVSGGGDGLMVWQVTSDVLPAQVHPAPALGTLGSPAQQQVIYYKQGGTFKLSSGSYTKLTLISLAEVLNE